MYVQQKATMTVHAVHNKMLDQFSFMETRLKKTVTSKSIL